MRKTRLFIIILLSIFICSVVEASDVTVERALQKDLQHSHSIAGKTRKKHKKGESVKEEVSELKSQLGGIESTDLLVREKFRQREEELGSLNPRALERHKDMVEGYKKAINQYIGLIEGLPPDGEITEDAIDYLNTFMDRIVYQKRTPVLGTLPYRKLSYPPKEPSQGSLVMPAYKGGDSFVGPEDTADTKEAPISEDIASLAQSLSWNPVLIYEYVKNNVETEWYRGCMKGAEETLRQKSGNDCDQAALLISLLRASGFPSRYVRGTIEFFAGGRDGVAIEKVRNLLGIDDPLKIAEFFQKAGIPFRPVIEGGGISNFRIEHIYVESLIPYANYRGTVIDEYGKRWLGLDTSIKVKGYEYNDLSGNYELPAVRDEYLNAEQAATPLEYLKENLIPGGTPEGYELQRTLLPEVLNILPDSMQFNVVSITGEYAQIPEELKHKVRFTAKDVDKNILFDITLDTLDLSNRKISLFYEPETVEDQEIIDSYGGMDNTPAYLVRLRPSLRVDGETAVVASGGLPMGADYDLMIDIISPNGTESIESAQIAGNLSVIGIAAGKTVGAEQASYGEPNDAETILSEEVYRYIGRWNRAEDELASLFHLVITRPVPTVTTIGGVIDVTYLLDLPHGFEWKGEYIDSNLRAIETVPSSSTEGGLEREKAFMELSALEGSVLEHRIFEDDFRVDSISTAKLIQLNNGQEAGVGDLLKIDKTNVDSVLADLDLSDDIKADITNAVNEGLVVRIPEVNGLPVTAMDYEDWTGLCYIKEDPDTGEAGYMLSGMVAKGTVPDLPAEQSRAVESGLSPALIAGGMTAVSPDKWVSRDLRNTLDQPYLENIVINPVAVNIIFPYDGAILSVSTVDVEGIASDPIAVVTVNGTNATVSKDGRFIAKGVALKEGPNLIEVAASSIFGGTASAVIRVSYKPSQATPMKISVTYPPDGDTINRPFTMVKGKVITDAKEISLKVNGIPAEIYGDQFVINDVPLTDGDNAIIANAVDSDGSVARDEVSVKADTLKPCVTLSANITSGIPSLTTYFRASTEMPGPVANYQVDFDGDGVIDYTGEALEDVSYTYTTEGIYYPEVIVTDDQGNTFTDSIAITVLNKAQIDALLKRKWEGMKTELENGNIAEAGRFFIVRSQERYRTIFEALKDKLPTILSTFTEFNIVSVYERIAEYEIVANENGTLYSYPGIFIKDVDGIWKFKDF